jgi:16S rRNA (adenine1518-N6/adenine1519-N6)-dimethyltransferase
MNLTSKKFVKGLLKKYCISPSKGLGQNFLIDKNVVRKFIEACNLEVKDIVLEVGPGIGSLTQALAKKAKKVIAVEKDLRMCKILKETMEKFRNVEVIQDDIRKITYSEFRIRNSYKLIGNLPFYLTAPVIRKFLEYNEARPRYMVFMVQKEVGQRICARPPKMSILAVSVQFYAQPKIISYVSKKSFWPFPKVDSAIIKIIPKKKWSRTVLDRSFFRVVKAGFYHPRKQLINNLSKELEIEKEKVRKWLLKNDIKPEQRAETLTIKDWLNLTKSYKIK